MIDLPYFHQEQETSCVSACARMVLAGMGIDVSEIDLRTLLQVFEQGAGIWELDRLTKQWQEMETSFAEGLDLAELERRIASGTPAIVLLDTIQLSYWHKPAFHAIVVVGLDDASVYIHDPVFPPAARPIPREEFTRAWQPFRGLAAFLTRKTTDG
jgi:ABC-type bacteriocin/lantibiotic exporter with double-glycine peptidase domain